MIKIFNLLKSKKFKIFIVLLVGLLFFKKTITLLRSHSPKINFIKGINYHPMKENSFETNSEEVNKHLQKIAELGTTHIGLYNCGKFDWEKSYNITFGEEFCKMIYPIAEKYNLKLIVGYFSNQTQDWTDIETQNRATTQFQELVLTTKDSTHVDYYLIGNEVFEKLGGENEKIGYAKWIEKMVSWTITEDNKKKVIYADNSVLSAIPYLRKYTPSLEIYAINDYEWSNSKALISRVNKVRKQIPRIKGVILHEWGSDSFEVGTYQENYSKQAERITYLAAELKKSQDKLNGFLLGAFLFSFNDDLTKVGNHTIQDPDSGAKWSYKTCFDSKANEDYWGIYEKSAFEALKSSWSK